MKQFKDLRSDEFSKEIGNNPSSYILDVRTPEEFMDGRIPGSINIDVMNDEVFHSMMKSLDKSKSCYIYCRSGGRSARACSIMAAQGFTTYNLIGGISAWEGELTY